MTYDVMVLRLGRKIINYVYIIVDRLTKQAAIVDPAWDMPAICSVIEKNNLQIVMILLTHSHEDHVQLVEPLVSRYNCKVYISIHEANFYQFQCSNMQVLDDGSRILLGGTAVTCILTPGHTAGGMCYSLSHSLFTGDTIFIEGCGICSKYGGDPYRMFESMRRIRTMIEPNVLIYPGHSFGIFPGVSMKYVIDNNLYFQIDDVETFVRFRMRPNQPKDYKYV
ncbi:MBL fold metallo-hydrolase [Brevibacillus laterosporus]|uniref:Polyketide biosynthesis protein n=1 Tax=Brevibacillus laterosporus TaxID=1465 RepID=A0A0F7EJE9_BRELA|nr:MBL fold metallo-hydrolase [Brevibacillus laterosporus]AKF95943.1 polyketide biosynthesis protein [Brevibacillus laterosporus]